jgi:hypothetical protein
MRSTNKDLNKPTISRRTLLKGLGGVVIGLPLLEEMLVSSALAAPTVSAGKASAAVPIRAFNLFFGLGIPSPLQSEGFAGVMEPLQPLSSKLLILRNVDHVRCDKPGDNAHYDGSTAAFTAEPPNGTARAGGASLDQMIRLAHHPDGMPEGMVPTLVGGTFFRRDRVSRHTKSFNPDGTVAATMQETPRELFERVFGSVDPAKMAGSAHRQRHKRSVLDSVVEQYKFYTGQRSPLGAASRSLVADHLERIREYEQRAFTLKPKPFQAPPSPPDSKLLHGGAADPGGEGIDITLEDLTTEWHLMADLYALAIQCDLVRFGSLTFLSAGERIRLKGQYEYGGKTIYQFNDGTERKSSGAQGCSHEWWHDFNESKKNEQLRAHAHMKMREIAYFLQRLDGPESKEANGKSILENSLITISTESGDGRHNDVKRELSGVFHAITGANGRFKTGQILDANAEGLDVYNTIIEGMGVTQKLGPANREKRAVDKIRA